MKNVAVSYSGPPSCIQSTDNLGLDTTERVSSPSEEENIFSGEYQTTSEGSQERIEPTHVNGISNADELTESIAAVSHLPDQQTLANPNIKHIARVFPPYLCDGIRQTGGIASVTMAYAWPPNGQCICLMSLHVLSNKLQYIAMELFGTNLESDKGAWFVVQDNGGRLSFKDMTLQGAQDKGFNKLFGPQITHAIETSPVRMEEASLATRAVTLQITGGSLDDGVLNLDLGLAEWFRIKDTLFPIEISVR